MVYTLNGKFVDDTEVQCLLPPIKKSALAFATLSFGKKRWTVSKVKQLKSLSLEIYAPAPTLLSAKMQNNYRQIVLKFSSAVWTSQKSCSKLFSTATIALFGNKFRCWFKGYTSLNIQLPSSATIRSNDRITLRKNVMKSRFQAVMEYTPETNISLIAPDVKLSPVAYISGQSVLGVCDRLILSGRKSSGSGGRRLKFYWGVDFADSVNETALHSNITSGLTSLKQKLASLSNRKNALFLKPEELETDVTYNFTLYVENYYLEISNNASHEVLRSSNYMPQLRILGGRRQTIKASRLSKIQSRARIPKCMTGKNDLNFEWEIDDTSVTLDEKSSSKSNLYLEPGTLSGDNIYTLTITVSLKADPLITASVSMEITVKSSPLVARIKGGRRRIVGNNEDIILDGSLSYDPDRSDDEEWYDWECADEEGLSCFVPVANTDGEYEELLMDSAKKVTINGGLLESDKIFNFTLSYQKGMRRNSKYTIVKIMKGRPPAVKIKNQRKIKENVDKFVVVRGRVFSLVGNMRIWVECVDEDGFSYIDLSEENVLLTPVEVVGVGSGNRPVGMVFNKNVLDRGVSYKFIMYAEQSEGIGYSEIILTTNAPPTIGMLESDVENGVALETEFTLSAVEGWEDDADDLPLLYNFGYYTLKGKRRYLGSPSSENAKVFLLPAGNPDDNNQLVVFVEVSDIHGSKSENVLSLIVTTPAVLDADAITNVMSTIDGALTADDLSSSLGFISSSLTTFDATAPGN